MADELEPEALMRAWDARAFLQEDYGEVPDDEVVFFRFFATGLAAIGRELGRGLELGGGPTLHRAAQLVRWVRCLDLADYDESNLEEIRRWLRGDPDAHDWSAFFRAAVQAERDGGSVADREALLRRRLGSLIPCDIRKPSPLGAAIPYDLLSTSFCLEWATPTFEGWRANLSRATDLLASGGWLFMLGVHDAEGRLIKGQPFRCARVTRADLRRELLALGFGPSTIQIELTPGTSPEAQIHEIFMVCAQKG
jgi:NNMT/PNMT/TEMT family